MAEKNINLGKLKVIFFFFLSIKRCVIIRRSSYLAPDDEGGSGGRELEYRKYKSVQVEKSPCA